MSKLPSFDVFSLITLKAAYAKDLLDKESEYLALAQLLLLSENPYWAATVLEAGQKKLVEQKDEENGGRALFRAFRGLPKYKPLIKYLSESGIKSIMQNTENYYLQDNSKLMPEADEPLYYTIEEKNNSIVSKVLECSKKGQPILIFTLSLIHI